MPLTPPDTWPGGAPDDASAQRILLEYLTFMHGETVPHAALIRVLKNQYGWTDNSDIEDVITTISSAYDMVIMEDVFCCCAPVPCYRIRDDCDSIKRIVAILDTSPNGMALMSRPHVAACL